MSRERVLSPDDGGGSSSDARCARSVNFAIYRQSAIDGNREGSRRHIKFDVNVEICGVLCFSGRERFFIRRPS